MADRAQAARAKWWPYAGVGPVGQAIADTTTPRAPQLAYLLRHARLASSVRAEPSRSRSPLPAEPPPLPHSRATAKNAAASQLQAPPRSPLARRRLHAVSQPLVRPHSAFPRRRNLVGGEPAVANHHRSSLPPFSPIPCCLCELLMLTPSLGRSAMAGVGRRTLRSAAATTIADGDLLLYS